MTQEQKRASLENELKQIQADTTVQIAGNGFKVNHRGYEVQIDDNYRASIKEPFNAEEWDKLAATEDCFQWGSNTPGEEGYDVIIGYTEKAQSYTKLRIPSRCKRIVCDGTFYEGSTDNTTIGRAFIANVQEIEIPSTVVEIGAYAFSTSYNLNSSLEKVIIPDSVTSIGYYAFKNCTSLTEITIPSSVTNIEGSAFSGCTSLTEITIPSGVTNIGYSAFSGCTSLTDITISNNLIEMGSSVFNNTKWYNNQPDGVVYLGNILYKYKGTMPANTIIDIKEGTRIIAGEAFDNCTSLTEITIPSSVTNIGDSAFSGCTSLTEITIPSSVTNIGDSAFSGCTSLTDITISNNLIEMGSSVFNNTKWYNNQPDGVVYLGNILYKYKGTMPANTIIDIKEGTRIIAGKAFYGCTSLTEITIPSNVTSIGEWAFCNCTSLTEMTIPNSVTSIGYYAFSGCNITVKCRVSEKPAGWSSDWNKKSYSGETVNVIWGYTGE